MAAGMPAPGKPAVRLPTAAVTEAGAPPGALPPDEGDAGVAIVASEPVSVPSALTVLPSVDVSALPLPACVMALPSLPSALPSVVSTPPTGAPSPVVAPSVCVAEVSVLASGTMAVTATVVTCSTGIASASAGVALLVAPLLSVVPLSFDQVGESGAISDDVDCEPLPPSDAPMSPLPDVAQPVIPDSDTIARMPGVRRANRRHRGKTPRFGGLDLNKKAGTRILSLHNSERLLAPFCLRSLAFGYAVAVVMSLATARPAVTDNAPVRATLHGRSPG